MSMTAEPTFPPTEEIMNSCIDGLPINDNEETRARTSIRRVAIGVAFGAASVGLSSGSVAVAEAPNTGCAEGNQNTEHGALLLDVAELLALGYRVPGILDDPANGGNGDGFVCGVALGNKTTPFGGQVYLFSDNQFFPGPG
jgi:hypothetical protein